MSTRGELSASYMFTSSNFTALTCSQNDDARTRVHTCAVPPFSELSLLVYNLVNHVYWTKLRHNFLLIKYKQANLRNKLWIQNDLLENKKVRTVHQGSMYTHKLVQLFGEYQATSWTYETFHHDRSSETKTDTIDQLPMWLPQLPPRIPNIHPIETWMGNGVNNEVRKAYEFVFTNVTQIFVMRTCETLSHSAHRKSKKRWKIRVLSRRSQIKLFWSDEKSCLCQHTELERIHLVFWKVKVLD